MNLTPKISIIVPVYKVEKYLHRCIDSILSQSFTDFELILVDDGSPDNCGKICDEYAQKDSRIRVFHKPNGGVSSARNLGLNNARGEWIAFVDSDDYIEVDYLEELISYETINNSEIIAISNKLDEKNKSITLSRDKFGLLFSLYKFDKFCPPWGKLFKKNIIFNHKLRFNIKIRLGEDMMFVLSYLLNTEKITLVSSNKYNYEIGRPDSLTKVLNSYDTELAGYHEIVRIVDLIIENLDLDNQAIYELERTKKFYIERTLSSIMKLSNRKDRLNKMRELDLSIYYNNPYNLKKKILQFLSKKKSLCFFYFYDRLLKKKCCSSNNTNK